MAGLGHCPASLSVEVPPGSYPSTIPSILWELSAEQRRHCQPLLHSWSPMESQIHVSTYRTPPDVPRPPQCAVSREVIVSLFL